MIIKEGKLLKGIGGFYYIINNNIIYECRGRGLLREKNITPTVGDNIRFSIIDEEKKRGVIEEILDRKNILYRPKVSNIDKAFIIMSLKNPEPNLYILDKIISILELYKIEVIIGFSKSDLIEEVDKEYANKLIDIYKKLNYNVILFTNNNIDSINLIKKELKGYTTVFTGLSGVGKSTLINKILEKNTMETGEISKKLKKGRHTTRHLEMMEVDDNTWIIDTPGFSSFDISGISSIELCNYFREIGDSNKNKCKFINCLHLGGECNVIDKVRDGIISESRYNNYLLIYNEIREREKKY